jgi:SpoVK/Ycf46/Vps4 family AAA+-type ATPase
MTTNRIEALGATLLRPGRMDYRLYLGNASEQPKAELYRRFFPDASETDAREIVRACRSAETMAEFQDCLLEMTENSVRTLLSDWSFGKPKKKGKWCFSGNSRKHRKNRRRARNRIDGMSIYLLFLS